MRTIHKFLIKPGEHTTQMPKGAVILDVDAQGPQHDFVYVWAIVDTDAPIVGRDISSYGTGSPLDEHAWKENYVGSVHGISGGLVFHFFDHGEVET
jgi:hypothetical protein